MTKVLITERCREEDLPRLPKKMLSGLIRKLELLADDPGYGKPLHGELKGYNSLRLGRYRIIYRYDQQADVVWIIAAGLRKESSKQDIYEKLARLLRSGKIELE